MKFNIKYLLIKYKIKTLWDAINKIYDIVFYIWISYSILFCMYFSINYFYKSLILNITLIYPNFYLVPLTTGFICWILIFINILKYIKDIIKKYTSKIELYSD